MMGQKKKICESATTFTQIVLPNDANPLGYLRGGKLMDWIDIASEITAQKHTGRIAVTVAIDVFSFKSPISVGDIVTVNVRITRTFRTSLEIRVDVWAENTNNKKRLKTNEAYLTFVAIDKNGMPVEIPGIIPEMDEEKKQFKLALRRRKARLARLANR